MAKKEKSEAAEKIEKAAKAKKAGSAKSNKENIFVRIGKWFKKFFKDLKGDIKKITWPNAKTVLKSTLVVIVSIAVIGLAVFAVDWCLKEGIKGLKSLATHYSVSQTVDEGSAKEDKKETKAEAKTPTPAVNADADAAAKAE